ncbi:MAG: hypothetical protein KF852_17475 [Saprospiraceae bacterium]|nr:hypothetical protein [Saprospiraceae bacterium]
MKNALNHHLLMLLLGFLLAGAACPQAPGNQKKESNAAASTSLTMAQADDGKWVIMDSQKTVLYGVFLYDNGPDYPAEGLIRVVKNGKIGYADADTYAIVIEPQFDCAFPFENGQAKVSNECQTVKDGEHSVWESDAWQYIDKQGGLKKQD